LIDLARDIKRRGRDFQEGRLTIQSVREALSRGERSERIFHDSDRSGSGGGHERMERGGGSDRGDRGRDEHGGRSGSERSDRGDRSRSGREGR
jgi:hypothetical protein